MIALIPGIVYKQTCALWWNNHKDTATLIPKGNIILVLSYEADYHFLNAVMPNGAISQLEARMYQMVQWFEPLAEPTKNSK